MTVTCLNEPSERVQMRLRYARVARFYDLLDAPLEWLYARGRRWIGEASEGLTLEFGAGTGKNFAYYPARARVIALDMSGSMLTRARRRIRPPIRALLIADVAHVPVRASCVDTVTGTFVVCVLANPRQALGEIERVLRPGGRAVFMEYMLPKSGWLRWLLRALEPLLHTLYGVSWQHHVAEMLAARGLQLIETRPVWQPLIALIVVGKPSADERATVSLDA